MNSRLNDSRKIDATNKKYIMKNTNTFKFRRMGLLTFGLALASVTIFTACNKEKNKPAKVVEGTYVGSGTDQQGSPFVNITVTVTEVDKNTVEISSSNSSVFSSFETDLVYTDGAVTNSITGPQSITVAFDTNEDPISLGISNGAMSFGGEKN